MDQQQITVERNADAERYEARYDGEVAGVANYGEAGGVVTFTHTEVHQEGKGIGSRLAAGALDDVRERRLKVVARCPFIRSYIERHPEYEDLLEG